MLSIKERIVRKLQNLPESNLREVLDLVEYLEAKRANASQNDTDPLLSVLGIVSAEPLSSDQIDEELYGPLLVRDGVDEGEA